MQILFALFVIALLAIGLYNRKKHKKEWVKEERKDESGDWIDKRAGERGTWGSLDEEMELARKNVARQSRINELTLLVRSFAFEQYPGFHTLSDDQIKKFSVFSRNLSSHIIPALEQIKDGREPEPAPETVSTGAYIPVLKKQILDFAYQNFPDLLNLDLEAIRKFDLLAGKWATSLITQIQELK